MDRIRLSKYFTDCGIMSRRAAECEIASGNVTVNGHIATVGEKVSPQSDEIIHNGNRVLPKTNEKICIMMNKPRGVVCTASDEKGRTNVTHLCKNITSSDGSRLRLYPIGRLDMDSDGLLLLTNDGELANKLTHPRHSVPKIYHVSVRGKISSDVLHTLGQPIIIDGKETMPLNVTVIAATDNNTILRFELFEGRNRQIRRICESAGVKISQLSRVAIGKLKIGALPIGKWRYLTDSEIEYLNSI